jgi:hypothetical protein
MYPPQIEAIRRERENFNKRKLKTGQWGTVPKEGLLLTKTANDWMKQEFGKPAAKLLFGSLWFENELCILFADTNMGKSVLAVQLADCLTKCYSFEPFYNQADGPLKVLYVDFELSAKQFEARYIKQAQLDSYLFSPIFTAANLTLALALTMTTMAGKCRMPSAPPLPIARQRCLLLTTLLMPATEPKMPTPRFRS